MESICVSIIIFVGILMGNQNRLTDGPFTKRSEVFAIHGMADTAVIGQ